ncbi:MAG TPA: purine-nucleoside phosphorylase [Vicinamibacterales bacterium]|jgi:purine-nucleoside phosphorylase|nr:purine-nucleoside phosphorylase [Vicinamibacterales bacterium]
MTSTSAHSIDEALARIDAAAADLRARLGGDVPSIALVLGSGLGGFTARLQGAVAVPYGEIAHWPTPTVVGHAGQLVAGTIAGRRVLVLSGRAHYYEGHPFSVVTFATRVLGRLGVKTLVVTNAAGGINAAFSSGLLMVIDDHINFMGSNPLIGPNDARLGPRFCDMSAVYSPRLRAIADEAAREIDLAIGHGVYLAVTGPSYETPAEIRAFRALGADAVGMSTVPEAIVARHMGLDVLGLSCISNMAAGMQATALSAEEVIATTARVQGDFIRLLEAIIGRL